MNRRAHLKALSTTALGLGAYASWSRSAFAQTEEIVFGAILPLTGTAAQVGLEQQTGLQFAVDRINAAGGVRGRRLRVVYEDTQGRPDLGVLAFNRLIDLQRAAAIFTAYSGVSLAIAPLATRRKVLVINPAAQSNKLGDASPFLVNTIPLVKDEVAMIATYAAAKIGKRAAILYENNAVGIDQRDEFTKAYTAAGGVIVADESVEFGSTDLRPALLKIAAIKADLMFQSITSGPDVVVNQIAQVPGLPVGVGNSFFSALQGYQVTAGWYQSAVRSAIPPDVEKEYTAAFKTKEMGFYAREYASAMQMLAKVLDHVLATGQPVTGESLKTTLFELKRFDSPSGEMYFQGNTAKRQIDIYRLSPPGRVLVDTPH